jgi:signal transduction histidine kinase/ligand-binding sensor domain-containing protein
MPECEHYFRPGKIMTLNYVPDLPHLCSIRQKLIGLIASLIVLSGSALAERLPVRIFSSADGLGSSFVDSLYRDSRGFMWFCTRDGLSRFDGSRFVTYRVGDGHDFAPGIESIFESKDGSYYISTTLGTFRVDLRTATSQDAITPQLTGEVVTGARGSFFEDSHGNLWVSSGALFRLVEKDGVRSFEKFELNLPVQYKSAFVVASIAEAPDGSVWFDTSWGPVRRFENGRLVFYPNESPITVGNSSMIADKTGLIWMTRADRVLVLKPEPAERIAEDGDVILRSLEPTAVSVLESEKAVKLPSEEGSIVRLSTEKIGGSIETKYAKYLFETRDGDIWISAEGNLLQVSQNLLHLHSSAEGLPTVMARMAEDTAGNLWIGGQSGLARLDRSGLVTYTTADGLGSQRSFAVVEDPNGSIFIGGGSFFLSRFDGHKFQNVRPGLPPGSDMLWTSRVAYRSSDGDWWILTGQKLYRFSGTTNFAAMNGARPKKIYGESDGLLSDHIYQMYEDSRGDIWISSRGSGGIGSGTARLRKGEERFEAISEAEGLPAKKSFASAVEDRSGNIWFTFYEGGLAKYDGSRFTYYLSELGLPEGILTDLDLDDNGRLWISSALSGVYRLDDPASASPSLRHISAVDGLSSDNIRTIAHDRMGRMYFGTVRGLDRLSPDTGRVKHYSVTDGLASDFVSDSHCDSRGDMWFATNDGLSRLTPLPDEVVPPPQIFIGSLRIAGVEQPLAELGATTFDKGDVSYTENNLQVEYFGLDLRAGNSLRYQYKLEGSNSDWSSVIDERTVSFANLSPANYKFLVRAVNSEGAVSEVPASFSIRILPPIWQRWWFLLGAVLFVGSVVTSSYRYRLGNLRKVNAALAEAKIAEEKLRLSREERLAELEKVRVRIATDLHDDIGASLTQIAVLSEVAQTRASGNGKGDPSANPLRKISEVSNELVGVMSDIVWSINPAKDHLVDVTQRMRRFGADLLTTRNIGFHFRAQDGVGDITLNSNVRREVFLIFKEALNNVVKHSGATQVAVEITVNESHLVLRIEDNGVGISINGSSSDDKQGGNGLLSMNRRAMEIGAEISFAPGTNGVGTAVTLILPLDSIHSTVAN